MLTVNEKKVLKLLLSSFDRDHSINQIARRCNLAPNGALKILKKFEQEGILKPKKIANIVSYKIDFDNQKTLKILELVLINDLKEKIKYRYEDLKELEEITDICIIFGSYIELKKEPDDLDVLFLTEKENYKEYKKKLNSLKEVMPVKVHDIVQTEEDLRKNIIKQDEVISEILKKGIVLWGHNKLLKVIKNVNQR